MALAEQIRAGIIHSRLVILFPWSVEIYWPFSMLEKVRVAYCQSHEMWRNCVN